MAHYVNSFSIDLGRMEEFEVVTITETVTIKDLTFESLHTYWKAVTTGELLMIRTLI